MKLNNEQKVMSVVLRKCWEDEAFKNNLINSDNPIAIIEELTNSRIKLPSGSKFVVVDQTKSGEVHINIPFRPDHSDMELRVDELELVTGGSSGLNEFKFMKIPRFECIES